MEINNIRRVIVFGVLAIVGILGTQSYWLLASWNLNEQEFSQKAHLALHRVAKALSIINNTDLPQRDIVHRRSNNTFLVNTDSEIFGPTLEYLLQRELEQLALNLDFEYAIFDCSTDQMLYGGYCTPQPANEIKPAEASDFVKEAGFTYYFTVKFPTRSGFILRNMQLVLFLSVILLVTVVFFAYTLTVILRQRRLAVLQKDFINNMTHEFKTPLATIRIAAGVFQREPHVMNSERLSRYATIIHEQYERLNQQVEKVLQIARIEQGQFDLKKESLELSSLLPNLLGPIQMRAEEKGGTLSYTLPAGPLNLNADPLHFSNIVHSLLDNALKYGGPQPQIHVGGQILKYGQLELTFADAGPGIAAEYRDKIFDKFFRIPTGDVHDVKGFGLGLYYVKEICRAHGWAITVHTAPGGGTLFRLLLPTRSYEASDQQTSSSPTLLNPLLKP